MAPRAGYTLIEVCCVIAMMVLLAAVAVPSIMNRMGEGRIDASADIVRARLADARGMAIDLNKPVRFGFIPGTGKFQVAADDSGVWDQTSNTDTGDGKTEIRGELLQDIVFGTDMNSISGTDSPSQGSGWQTGCVFLPEGGARGPVNLDGTSSDDSRFYFGKLGISPLGVEVRGITGASRIYVAADEGQ
jgi:prepilin-type N-terminal cleavage/methylation domain-containing protein